MDGAAAMRAPRRIGGIGTAARVLVGLALLALVFFEQPPGLIGGLELHDIILGLVVLPALMVATGLLGVRYGDGPLLFTGAAGAAANCVLVIALFVIPYTTGAAALFYGVSMLVAAWRALPGCEATMASNLILRRDDQIGCCIFSPIDTREARRYR